MLFRSARLSVSGLSRREASAEILAACDGQGAQCTCRKLRPAGAVQKELVRQIGLHGNGDTQRRVPRFICGTSCELERSEGGKFREDLYYGISGVCLRLPLCGSGRRRSGSAGLVSFAAAAIFAVQCRAQPNAKLFLEYNCRKHSRIKRCGSSHRGPGRRDAGDGWIALSDAAVNHNGNGEKIR